MSGIKRSYRRFFEKFQKKVSRAWELAILVHAQNARPPGDRPLEGMGGWRGGIGGLGGLPPLRKFCATFEVERTEPAKHSF
jgi:hypothetical protein